MLNSDSTRTNDRPTREAIQDAARFYTEHGWVIHAVSRPDGSEPSAGKAPVTSKWQTHETPRTEAYIKEHWGRGNGYPLNIGLQCGKNSGLVVLDCDDLGTPIPDELFSGLDRAKWVKQQRTPNRLHYFFKYTDKIPLCHFKALGIDFLTDKSNCILEPSIHKSGEVYRFEHGKPDGSESLPEMPEMLINRLIKLFNTANKLKIAIGRSGRSKPCAEKYFKNHVENTKDPENWHGESGRKAALFCATEAAFGGAGRDELVLMSKLMYRNHYDPVESNKQIDSILRYVQEATTGTRPDNKPWRCDTIRASCPEVTANPAGGSICDTCPVNRKFNGNDQETASPKLIRDPALTLPNAPEQPDEEKKKIKQPTVFINETGNAVMEKVRLFTMMDNDEIYVYQKGVYRNDTSKAVLERVTRDTYEELYREKFELLNDEPLYGIVPAKGQSYVADVIEWIKAYSRISREAVDKENTTHLNFKNCMLDLTTWTPVPHTPEILSTCQFNVTYDPSATCPMISHYLHTCELRDQDITVLMEYAGYSLTVDVALQRALMLVGDGSNGKSVFINVVKEVLGTQAVSNESLHTLENDKFRVANVYGKRLNAFPDLKDEALQTNEVFNIITGNDQDLTGERKYQSSFRFKPTIKMMFSANKPPFAYSDNFAYYRRWIIIEFPHTFTEEDRDNDLFNKLVTEDEKSGLLNMMLDGLKRVLEKRDFSYRLTVAEVERLYKMHADNAAIFAGECLRDKEDDYEDETAKSVVYNLYCMWCEQQSLKPISLTKFSQRMKKLGREARETTRIGLDGKTHRVTFYKDTVAIYANIPYAATEQTTLQEV